jgi:hypothetical protein
MGLKVFPFFYVFGQFEIRACLRGMIFVLASLFLGLMLGCANAVNTTSPPSNLVYPRTQIVGIVGQAILPDKPRATGSTASYAVSPALPAGLSLNSSTGTISGTPAAAAAQAAYLVTAKNRAGSTSATLQITVNIAPPSNLVYPQTTITAIVGQAITPDTPTVTGTVTSVAVSPALPAGLSMDNSTGTIAGTPAVAAVQAAYTVTATNGTGSAAATLQITVNVAAPSNLVYPQTTITAIVAQAIALDTPTVTGTVANFAVSPALPAGLSLNSSTGTILGTPTTTAAQAAYTVTAINGTGSASAMLQITVNVNPGAPSNLVYPQTTIKASVGQAITPDMPTVSGTVAGFAVSPALPGGLSLDSSTGTISGTPTTNAAQAVYTVIAANSLGSTTSNVTIAVVQPNILLELGHANSIKGIRFNGNRVLSADDQGHWALWNYASGALLASGTYLYSIDMTGQTVAIGIANGLEIRALSDGRLISMIVYPGLNQPTSKGPWWKLASDGSYICISSQTGIFVVAPTGQTVVSKSGDYSSANILAAPGKMLVALGPVGQNVIETISIVDGTSFVGPAFSGTFNSWFVDGGGRFLTKLSNSVWVYSDTSVQQAIVALPTIENLTGQGNWIWTYQANTPGYPLNIYSIGSNTPAMTYSGTASTIAIASGTTIGFIPYGTGQVSVIDLSGSGLSKADYAVPTAYLTAYGASSSSQWLAGNRYGAVLDGSSLSSAPRYFGHGAAWSIAGSSGRVAISTAIGEILVFDPYLKTQQRTIGFSSGKLALSSDGIVLGASANANDSQYKLDRTLNFYSLPSGNMINSFPYTFNSGSFLFDFTLAASGTTIGQLTGANIVNAVWSFASKVTATAGGSIIWLDTRVGPADLYSSNGAHITISPDGTMIGAYAGDDPPYSTNIFRDGTLVAAVPGIGIGWIDNDRILVNQYKHDRYGTAYVNAAIFNSAGAQLATLPLPELKSSQIVTSDLVYDPAPTRNALYSLTTGQIVWTGSFPSSIGAVAGPYVVYESGHSVVIEAY